MATCKKCKRMVKSPKAHSWDQSICPTCFGQLPLREITPEDLNILPNIITARLTDTPMDYYLDLYTFQEMEAMNV